MKLLLELGPGDLLRFNKIAIDSRVSRIQLSEGQRAITVLLFDASHPQVHNPIPRAPGAKAS
jgi:hypothetical protein